MERACETARSCAPDKVVEFAQVLANDSAPPGRRLFALKMVLHLVGDLHQPLHAATARVGRRNDAGANCENVAVQGLFGTQHVMSLHAYWDDLAVSSLDSDAANLARRLRASISRADVMAWAQGGPADWTWQSYQVARDVAYRYGESPRCDGPPAVLSAAYQKAAQAAAAEQLQRAGVRLAFVLNQSLTS